MTQSELPDNDQIALIQHSFPQLLAASPPVAEQFYERLASAEPDIFALFKEAEPAGQQQKLLAAMTLLVTNLEQPDLLKDYFQALGERHRQYGVTASMFQPFVDIWLAVIGDCLTHQDPDAVVAAWRELLDYIVALMQFSPAQPLQNKVTIDDQRTDDLSAHIADLLAQQKRLITQMSLTASRDPAAQHLLGEFAELRLLCSALQKALSQQS